MKKALFWVFALSIVVGALQRLGVEAMNIQARSAATRDGLDDYVAYWSFNETSGQIAHDESSSELDGEVHGAVWAEGISGNALDFNGINNYVDISDNEGYPDAIGSLSQGTISVWFKFDLMPDSNTILPVFYLGNRTGGGDNSCVIIEVGHFWPTSLLFFTVYAAQDEPVLCFDSNFELDVGTWYHFAIVVGSDFNTGYLNGEEMTDRHYNFGDSSDTNFFNDIPDKQVCWIGSGCVSFFSGTNYFDGKIDEIRIYDSPLSGDEISQYYQSVLDGTAPVPTPSYPLDIELDSASVSAGETLTVSWSFSGVTQRLDAYFGARLPDGSLLVMNPAMRFQSEIVPVASNIDVSGNPSGTLQLTVPQGTAAGTYTLNAIAVPTAASVLSSSNWLGGEIITESVNVN